MPVAATGTYAAPSTRLIGRHARSVVLRGSRSASVLKASFVAGEQDNAMFPSAPIPAQAQSNSYFPGAPPLPQLDQPAAAKSHAPEHAAQGPRGAAAPAHPAAPEEVAPKRHAPDRRRVRHAGPPRGAADRVAPLAAKPPAPVPPAAARPRPPPPAPAPAMPPSVAPPPNGALNSAGWGGDYTGAGVVKQIASARRVRFAAAATQAGACRCASAWSR